MPHLHLGTPTKEPECKEHEYIITQLPQPNTKNQVMKS